MIDLDLLPGDLVNLTVKESLSRRSVPIDAKYRILNEIASSLQLEPLPLEYTPKRQQQLEIPDNNSKLSNIPTKRNSAYLRATTPTTMPSERPKNDQSDSILQSNSFPFEQSTNHWSNAPRSPHVHPKLPEYDDIAEQFMALKKAALQKKCMEGRSNLFPCEHSTN